MAEDKPLAGLNIVVTRPREQAGPLAERISRAGGHPVLFPLLEISPVADPDLLQKIAARLNEFDLAIFISPNAVRYGIAAIGAVEKLPQKLRIATVGQGSALTLRDLGVQNIIAPQDRFDSEALLALPEMQDVRGLSIVIFRGDGGRELLGDTLKARGAAVEYAACYLRAKPAQGIEELLAANPDLLTVTSSEALSYLWDMLNEDDRAKLTTLPLFVPHERIAEAARKLGWRDVICTAGGEDGLFGGLLSWAAEKRSP
jgi:uroporphyrinogen-III synthase